MAAPEIFGSQLVLGARTTRAQVLDRAVSWLEPSVPYSQTKFHENEYGIYRTDCSGYISMAWGIPGRPPNKHGGLDTVALARAGFPVTREELRSGDILLRARGTSSTRHVAMFVGWADPFLVRYWGFEQAGGIGTVCRTISYPYGESIGEYRPYRYRLIEN